MARCVRARSRSPSRRVVGQVLDLGPRVRVVGQPPLDPDALDADGGERPAAVGQLLGLDDAGHGADVGAHVAAADLAPPLDEHDAELAGRRRGSPATMAR